MARFKQLAPRSRAAIAVGAVTQLGLLAIALRDLHARPADQVRGPKKAWYPALFVNFIGPLSYLRFGRRT
ncbi:MAG: hypothetical protein J7513_08380 [Solirubrobacteraceae bacterium]|nr:hypothetical protein [Solirubrobacteraceae bacterium]